LFRKTVSAIMMSLLALGTLALVFNVLQAKASGTIRIRIDGSIDPPTAPILSFDNVTYVFTGSVSGSVVVERSNLVVDGNGYTVQGDQTGNGLSLTNISNVTIKNVKVEKFGNGIYLHYSSKNVISGNNITDNNYGIYLSSSSNSTLRDNNMIDNKYSFNVDGMEPSDFINDVDFSNTVDGKAVCYWVNRQDEVVPDDAGYVAIVNSTGITVKNLDLRNSGQGILLAVTGNSTITGNNIADSDYGVALWNSSENRFYHNNFVNNTCQIHDYIWEYPWIIPSINAWDDGYPSGGNYWGDYNGTDADHDGVGDTQYIIDANNTDHYPLMVQYVIPEFSSFIFLPLLMVVMLLSVVVCRIVKFEKRCRKGR
jgi:parallel beta-helix repeat protein